MKKPSAILIACALATMAAVPAMARTNVNVSLSVGQAPPPPVVVVQHAPETVWLPETHVSVVRDDDFDNDTFQCGSSWYVYRDGWWYRGRSWRGPYTYVETRYVPQSILVVPARHWRHYPYANVPPGQWRKQHEAVVVDRRSAVVVKEKDHGRNEGSHHGHDHNDDDR